VFKEKIQITQSWLSEKIEIKASTVHGAGVFAREKIEKREVFEICPVILFHYDILKAYHELYESDRHILEDYIFIWPHTVHGSAGYVALVLGGGCVYNHTNKNPDAVYHMLNSDEEVSFPRMVLRATRDILPGEEIFIRYVHGSKLIFDESGTFFYGNPGSLEDLGSLSQK